MDEKESAGDSQNLKCVSPKHVALMSDSLLRLYEGTFNEGDIRALLIGIRGYTSFVTGKLKKVQGVSPNAIKGIPYIADIAHSVCHPELKNQGPIRDYVRSVDTQMAKALTKMASQKVNKIDSTNKVVHLALPPAVKPLSSKSLVMAFVLSLESIFPFKIDTVKISAHLEEIELCLFSILHFNQLPLLDGEGGGRNGYLAIHSYEGKYHLYAGVLASKFNQVLTKGVENEKPFILSVFVGKNLCEGQLEMDARNPKVVFADRDSEGRLKLGEYTSPLFTYNQYD
ncbi:MAG: hypothetical protein V3U89_05110 [Methylophilaceae bacterium]